MPHLSRRATAAIFAATSVVSLFGLASPASAKGGTPTPPAPQPVLLDCYGDLGPAYPTRPTSPSTTPAPRDASASASMAPCSASRGWP